MHQIPARNDNRLKNQDHLSIREKWSSYQLTAARFREQPSTRNFIRSQLAYSAFCIEFLTDGQGSNE